MRKGESKRCVFFDVEDFFGNLTDTDSELKIAHLALNNTTSKRKCWKSVKNYNNGEKKGRMIVKLGQLLLLRRKGHLLPTIRRRGRCRGGRRRFLRRGGRMGKSGDVGGGRREDERSRLLFFFLCYYSSRDGSGGGDDGILKTPNLYTTLKLIIGGMEKLSGLFKTSNLYTTSKLTIGGMKNFIRVFLTPPVLSFLCRSFSSSKEGSVKTFVGVFLASFSSFFRNRRPSFSHD